MKAAGRGWLRGCSLVLMPALATAQTTEPPRARHVVFAELLGSGLLYSLNYEHLLAAQRVGLRAGASFLSYPVSSYGRSGNLSIASFPVVASYYLGRRRHHLQLGLGATVLHTRASSDSQGVTFDSERSGLGLAASAVIGYRYAPPVRGVVLGIGFTPLLRAGAFLPWGGAHAGYTF